MQTSQLLRYLDPSPPSSLNIISEVNFELYLRCLFDAAY